MARYALKLIFPSVSSVLNYHPNPSVCAGPPAAIVAVRVTQDKDKRADVCCFLPLFPTPNLAESRLCGAVLGGTARGEKRAVCSLSLAVITTSHHSTWGNARLSVKRQEQINAGQPWHEPAAVYVQIILLSLA